MGASAMKMSQHLVQVVIFRLLRKYERLVMRQLSSVPLKKTHWMRKRCISNPYK
jgi:hypothetical protein